MSYISIGPEYTGSKACYLSIECMSAIIRFLAVLSSAIGLVGYAEDLKQEKLVIAHYMTDMLPRTEWPLNRWIDPELSDPNGSTSEVGGLQQTVPMASLYLKGADLEQAVDFEIRAARQLGVDGFQFFYPLGENTKMLSKRYNETIREFIRLSETRYPGFRVSVCLCSPNTVEPTTQMQRVALWGAPLGELMEGTEKSAAWLRSEDGNILFFLWVADALAESVSHRANTPDQIREVGAAYQQLADTAGVPIDYVYQIRRFDDDPPYLDAILETFSAVWGWTSSEENEAFWDHVAQRCHETGTTYTQSVYPDYYTSKTYSRDGNHEFLSVEKALASGPSNNERHYRVTNLTGVQVSLLERARERDAALINYITWNDYPEGHHLAPEMAHRFGPALLLRHFKEAWISSDVAVKRDEAVVFYKLYRHELTPDNSFPIFIKSANHDEASEDRIELVTFLTEPAECFLNEHSLGVVQSGLQIHSIPSEVGPIRVRVVRDGNSVIEFEAPTPITDSPLRTDRLTYSFSSAFDREMSLLFPEKTGDGKKP